MFFVLWLIWNCLLLKNGIQIHTQHISLEISDGWKIVYQIIKFLLIIHINLPMTWNSQKRITLHTRFSGEMIHDVLLWIWFMRVICLLNEMINAYSCVRILVKVLSQNGIPLNWWRADNSFHIWATSKDTYTASK